MQSNCVLPQGFAHLPTALLQWAVPHTGPSSVQAIVPAVDMPVAVVVGAAVGVVPGGGAVATVPGGGAVGYPVAGAVGCPPYGTQPGGGLG